MKDRTEKKGEINVLKFVERKQKQIVPNEGANKESTMEGSKQRGTETLGRIITEIAVHKTKCTCILLVQQSSNFSRSSSG
jgi:hypothetical protein